MKDPWDHGHDDGIEPEFRSAPKRRAATQKELSFFATGVVVGGVFNWIVTALLGSGAGLMAIAVTLFLGMALTGGKYARTR